MLITDVGLKKGYGMQIKLDTGFLLDDQKGFAPDMQKYAQNKGLNDVRVFHATEESGRKLYVVVEGETPVFDSQQTEAIYCHIDVMWLIRK